MPKKDVFGTPEAGDATALLEEDIEWAAQQVAKFYREDAPDVINRPPGMLPKEPEAEKEEWLMVSTDVEAATMHFQQLVEAHQGNMEMAAVEWIDWGTQMRKKYDGST